MSSTQASRLLAPLNRGFRAKYLDYGELTAQLEAWAQAFPELLRLESIGRSTEGRELWLVKIGRNLHEQRPAAWVDGNMHATEVSGSSVALAIAEDILALHLDDGSTLPDVPAAMAANLRDIHVYVLPRISPDGAEAALATGRYVRSSPVDDRPNKNHAYWRSQDVDGDGRIGYMRQETRNGELVELPGHPGVLVPRRPEDAGPFYRVYLEGVVANFDGHHVPNPGFLADNQFDLNRNFACSWRPEPEQEGAGDYPGSAPETQAIMRFASQHPNIFVWLDLHTFGGVGIRPLSHGPDSKMNEYDAAVFQQVGAWLTDLTGYPMVSMYEEFLYGPEKLLHGSLTDYAYHQRGAIAYVVELWDLMKRIGVERQKPFFSTYRRWERKDHESLARFDREQNQGRIFQPWRPFCHPQLGPVEIGGPDLLVGITNPPYELLGELCRTQSAAYLKVASLLPRIELELLEAVALGSELTRVSVKIQNCGYLGTYGLPSAMGLPHNEPLRISCQGAEVEIITASAFAERFHLDGWGRGLYQQLPFFQWTRGNGNERIVTFVAKGKGRLTLRVESCRVGCAQLVATLP